MNSGSYDEQVRILCVDDEKNVLKAIERLFMDDDYEILTASSADEGIEMMKSREPIQIIISDYRMPGMNGVEFLKEVKNHWPLTVRIVLSGYADASAIVSAINEGQIYKFIPKPWNDDELRVATANAVERYFLYKKNSELTDELRKKNEELLKLTHELKKYIEDQSASLKFRTSILETHQNILDAMPVGILGIDDSGMIVLSNSAWSRMAGESICPVGCHIGKSRIENLEEIAASVREAGKMVRDYFVLGERAGVLSGVTFEAGSQKGTIIVFTPREIPE